MCPPWYILSHSSCSEMTKLHSIINRGLWTNISLTINLIIGLYTIFNITTCHQFLPNLYMWHEDQAAVTDAWNSYYQHSLKFKCLTGKKRNSLLVTTTYIEQINILVSLPLSCTVECLWITDFLLVHRHEILKCDFIIW